MFSVFQTHGEAMTFINVLAKCEENINNCLKPELNLKLRVFFKYKKHIFKQQNRLSLSLFYRFVWSLLLLSRYMFCVKFIKIHITTLDNVF